MNVVEVLGRRSVGFVLSLAWLLAFAIGFLDLVVGQSLSLSVFYLLPVALATWYVGRPAGYMLAFVCAAVWLGAEYLSGVRDFGPWAHVWGLGIRFGFLFFFAWALYALKRAEDRPWERELEIAHDIQLRLLPHAVPTWPGFEIAVRLAPAQRLSGDYYDFFPSRDTMDVLVADVMGKGIPASLMMSNIHAVLHGAHPFLPGPEDLRDRARLLNRHLLLYTGAVSFVTLVFVALPRTGGTLHVLGAGHPPGLRFDRGAITPIPSSGPAIGILEDADWTVADVDLPEGALLVLYTDGVTEARDPEGDLYGPERLEQSLGRVAEGARSAAEVLDGLLLDLEAFTTEPVGKQDDVLAVVIRRTGTERA